MERSSVFTFQSYKDVMRAYLRDGDQRGALSRAAEALGCQRSFLSRIMNSKMQITPDLAFKLCVHWRLASNERDFFQLLVELERAVDITYEKFLREKVKRARDEHESLSNRSKRPEPTTLHDIVYFSGWHWTAIHFLTSIAEYQTVDAIAARLQLSRDLVTSVLQQLLAWDFVSCEGKRWIYKGGEYHLPKDSPLVMMHHQNWRQQAVMDAHRLSSDNIHFTNVHTVSRADLPRLKEMLLEFISQSNELLRSSKEEDCVVLLCDLFKVGG